MTSPIRLNLKQVAELRPFRQNTKLRGFVRPKALKRHHLLLALSATLLSACGGDPAPAPEPTPTPTEQAGSILGQITPWTAGDTASVKYAQNDTATPFVQAPVSADGQFTLQLPNHATVTANHTKDLQPPQDFFGACINVVNTSTPGLKILPIASLYTDKYERLILRNAASEPLEAYKAWWFATQDGTLAVKADDCLGVGDVDVNLSLKKGWNVIDVVNNTGISSSYTLTTPPTERTTWTYYIPKNAVQAQALKWNIFEPWKNLPQHQNR